MPFARAHDGTRIYYEVVGPGSGPGLLMIQGLGTDRRGWVLQRAALSRRHRCVAIDNRGVGRSDKPTGPYDLEVMALDAISVLDALDMAEVDVMGASMGGVIAQILAVRHPERVRSLILACTACSHQPWRDELLQSWADTVELHGMRALNGESLRWLVGPRAHRRFYLPAHLLGWLLLRSPAHSFVSQVQAILAMPDGLRRYLELLDVPTLILVGSQDILTPVGDAEELHDMIPGSELVVFSGAAHGLMVEAAGAFNRAVDEFSRRVSALARRPRLALARDGGGEVADQTGRLSTRWWPTAASADTTGPPPNGFSASAASTA